MNKTRILAALSALLLTALPLSSCGNTNTTTAGGNNSTGGDDDSATDSATHKVSNVYTDKEYGFQTEMPAAGDTVAIMHTSMGDISIRLFPEAAPKAVQNFVTHAQNGYYDGLTFHRVMEDFMIQGGDPKGDGTGGESIWGDSFEDEFDQKLLNIRGSLAMANSGANTNGSQFFINQAGPDGSTAAELKETFDYETLLENYEGYYDSFVSYYGDSFTTYYPDLDSFIDGYIGGISPDSRLVPDAVWDLYAAEGGNIHLDGAWRATGGHTVFGQVYAGMDVVDAIAAVEVTDPDNSDYSPVEDVLIQSIEITTYTETN